MDTDHELVVVLVLLDKLQGTGLVGRRAIDGVAQHQENGLVGGKVYSLINGMTEAALLVLIDVMQTLADVQNVVLVLLGRQRQLAQMFLGQLSLEELRILLAFLLGTQHQTDFLNTTLDKLFQQDEDDWTDHSVGTGYGEEVFLQCTGSRIEARTEACHGNDSLADGMNGLQGQ